MFSEAVKLFSDYGWAAVILFCVGVVLLHYLKTQSMVWRERGHKRISDIALRKQSELTHHQFFANIDFRLHNEIPTLVLNHHQPVRQKVFRKLLAVTLQSLREIVDGIVKGDIEKMTPYQWASFVNGELNKIDNIIKLKADETGIPKMLVRKFVMWKSRSAELLSSYVNDLAISEVHDTNIIRTNTLLYLLSLQLVTIIGDAEHSLMVLNGELSGLLYNGEVIE